MYSASYMRFTKDLDKYCKKNDENIEDYNYLINQYLHTREMLIRMGTEKDFSQETIRYRVEDLDRLMRMFASASNKFGYMASFRKFMEECFAYRERFYQIYVEDYTDTMLKILLESGQK